MHTLRQYQTDAAIELIKRKRLYLLSDMGSGKTAIVLTALSTLVPQSGKWLIVAPKLVAMSVWAQELEKWALPIKLVPLLGSPAKRKNALKSEGDVFLINYELLPWLANTLDLAKNFNGLILDEISRMKRPNKVRWRSVLSLAESAKYVWGLTGTPISTSLLDLFGQYRLLSKDALGPFMTHYRQEYFYCKDPNCYTWLPHATSEAAILERIAPFTHQVSTESQLAAAETFTNVNVLTLDSEQFEAYKEIETEFVVDLPDGKVLTIDNAGVMTGKLMQFIGGALYDEDGKSYHSVHPVKYNALDELLENLLGQPVLVVFHFQFEAKEIMKRHPEAVWLKSKNAQQHIDAWNRGEISIMLIHPSSAGHGLNLQEGGHHLIWYSGTWSQELYRQTNARLARSGQKHPVYIHHLRINRTIDMLQHRVVIERMSLQEEIRRYLIEHKKTCGS